MKKTPEKPKYSATTDVASIITIIILILVAVFI